MGINKTLWNWVLDEEYEATSKYMTREQTRRQNEESEFKYDGILSRVVRPLIQRDRLMASPNFVI